MYNSKHKVSFSIIYNEDGNVLMGQRRDTGRYSFIGGGIKQAIGESISKETARETVSREVFEEAGIHINPQYFEHVATHNIDEDGVQLYLYSVTISNQTASQVKTEFDPGGEFTSLYFIHPSIIKSDSFPLHIPKEKDVILQHVKDTAWTKESAKHSGVMLDAISVSLSPKERLKLQIEVGKLMKEIKESTGVKSAKELLKLQIEVGKKKRKLGIGNNAIKEKQNNAKNEIIDEAIKVVQSVTTSDISSINVESLSFFTDRVLSDIENTPGSDKKTQLSDMLSILMSKLKLHIEESNSEGVELDSLKSDKFTQLLKIALDPTTPNGKADRKKKQDAFNELSLLVKKDAGLLSLIDS